MRETGTVTAINGKTTVVSVDKKAECEGCGLCLFKEGANKAEFFVATREGVDIGDRVEIERSENGRFFGAVLAFFVPLALIGLAVLINYLFIGSEIFILALSLAFIAVWFAVLAATDKRFKQSGVFGARITAVEKRKDAPKEESGEKKQNTKE